MFLFIDVHNFKALNDQRGFEEGDRFLIAVGRYIAEVFHDSLFGRPVSKEELCARIDRGELVVSAAPL